MRTEGGLWVFGNFSDQANCKQDVRVRRMGVQEPFQQILVDFEVFVVKFCETKISHCGKS